ncbi:MAG: hypothetical protein ABI291_10055 [Acidobacteriaceae bacterium]
MDGSQPDPWVNRRLLIRGIAFGVLYGLFLRAYAFILNRPNRVHWQWLLDIDIVMTVAFLIGGPLVIGILTTRRAEASDPGTVWRWILTPWLSVILMMGVTALFAWEGAICIAMALPIALVFGSIGGIIGGLASRNRRLSGVTTFCIAALPFLLGPAEGRLATATQTRTVASEIRIHASSQTVWQNIERVPAISIAELRTNWVQRIGFPRPVEATLSYEGVGGVRHATFERGLTFIETVNVWDPEHRLAFGIKADTAHIPPTTLDEHVTIGGRYFDVLDGEYRIEPLANGDILLHLTSHQRLSTDFNGYAGFWSDAVMQTLQTSILEVIQHRCESSQQSTTKADSLRE